MQWKGEEFQQFFSLHQFIDSTTYQTSTLLVTSHSNSYICCQLGERAGAGAIEGRNGIALEVSRQNLFTQQGSDPLKKQISNDHLKKKTNINIYIYNSSIFLFQTPKKNISGEPLFVALWYSIHWPGPLDSTHINQPTNPPDIPEKNPRSVFLTCFLRTRISWKIKHFKGKRLLLYLYHE